ncbi:MAG: NUDIX domain-containing protein [Alphaproteobacteria bacterium]|nr:MAG: NUDIX domain-containing protein [Alphaproteobacteria bacterium]
MTDETPFRHVEVLERNTAYQGYIRVEQMTLRHSLSTGGMSQPMRREAVRLGRSVVVLPYDPVRDLVVMIEEFRAPPFVVGGPGWMRQLPAGAVEAGEEMAHAAMRELHEEAGLDAREMIPIAQIFESPGILDLCCHVFCALVEVAAPGPLPTRGIDEEDITVLALPAEQVIADALEGRIQHGPSLAPLLWLAIKRPSLRK